MSQDLERFAESRIQFVQHCLQVWTQPTDRHQRASAKYCFKQGFFYAAAYYVEWNPFISQGARDQASVQGLPIERLRSARWHDQPSFDPGRDTFHFEHVFTGEMCWTAVTELSGSFSSKDLSDLLRVNYATAWILKDEDGRLPRSVRGKTLQDALQIYTDKGVSLARP